MNAVTEARAQIHVDTLDWIQQEIDNPKAMGKRQTMSDSLNGKSCPVSDDGALAVSTIIVSCVKNARDTATQDYEAREIIESIRRESQRLAVEHIRHRYQELIAKTDGDWKAARLAIAEDKKGLPAALWSGRFSRRAKEGLLCHSGLLCADLDSLGNRLAEIRTKLISSPHLFALFLSPTGDGLKCVFRVPADAEKHKASFRGVEQHVRELTGVQIDESCSDVSRLCFLSHDPDAYLNDKAVELPPLAEVEKYTTNSGICAGAPEIETRRRIAVELLGEIDWITETSGYCACPGQGLHTTGDGERDCEIYLDKVPTIYCLHDHCRDTLKEKNHQLRSLIGKAERGAKIWVPANDLDRAKALVEETDGKFRFITDLGKNGKWVHWDSDHWEQDCSGAQLQECINDLLEKWKEEAERLKQNVITLPQAAQSGALKTADAVKHLAELARSRAAIDNMIALAKKEPGIAASIEDFDSDPWLLECKTD